VESEQPFLPVTSSPSQGKRAPYWTQPTGWTGTVAVRKLSPAIPEARDGRKPPKVSKRGEADHRPLKERRSEGPEMSEAGEVGKRAPWAGTLRPSVSTEPEREARAATPELGRPSARSGMGPVFPDRR